jgi:Protein of unknown function (DUF3455)
VTLVDTGLRLGMSSQRTSKAVTKYSFWTITLLAWFIVSTSGYGADSSQKLTVPDVPSALKVSPTEELLFIARAKGVQIYAWQQKKDNPAQYEWVFKSPEADLFDASGKKIGRHYAGPTWESSDGSKVVGELKAHLPSKDESAVPWLLLTAKKNGGAGIFRHGTSIQRLETVGGKAPLAGSNPPKAGTELRVPYTAVYYFYGSKT